MAKLKCSLWSGMIREWPVELYCLHWLCPVNTFVISMKYWGTRWPTLSVFTSQTGRDSLLSLLETLLTYASTWSFQTVIWDMQLFFQPHWKRLIMRVAAKVQTQCSHTLEIKSPWILDELIKKSLNFPKHPDGKKNWDVGHKVKNLYFLGFDTVWTMEILGQLWL